MNERYFYLINIYGDLIHTLYNPKYKFEKITIASNDFISDIEAFGELSKILNDPIIFNNYNIKFYFNKKYFPNNDKVSSKIEKLFNLFKEYTLEEVINPIAYITVIDNKEKTEDDDEDIVNDDDSYDENEEETNFLSPLKIKNGLEIKVFVISRKENLIDIIHQEKETLVH
jgi:hypothetical protein